MAMTVRCPNPACGKSFSADDGMIGRVAKCKHCRTALVIRGGATLSEKDTAPEPAYKIPASQPSADAATRIGRFEVRAKLGSGAFGTVYRAHDPQLDREVALKVPNPGILNSLKRVERFLREARAAGNLRHPNIVPIFEAGRDGDTFYIASDFIDGITLDEAVEEKGMDFRRAARIARDLADAAAYAHSQGIVHRDIKPANVMLDAKDRPHLMDFGLAARDEEAGKLTNDGAVIGTPAYMAPEQAAGKQGEARPESDQYALGVVLYELLTGKLPFEGPPEIVLFSAIHTAPPPPRSHRPYLPRDLEVICLKAMSKQPRDRYRGCEALAEDLRSWLAGEPIAARKAGRLERTVRLVRRHPALAGVSTLVILAFVATVAVLSSPTEVQRRRAERAEQHAAETARLLDDQTRLTEQTREEARLARVDTDKATQEGRQVQADLRTARAEAEQARKQALEAQAARNAARADAEMRSDRVRQLEAELQAANAEVKGGKADLVAAKNALAEQEYVRAIREADRERKGNNVTKAVELLKGAPEDFRGWEWHWLHRICDPFNPAIPRTLKGHTEAVLSASFSPDGKRLVTGSKDGTARVWEAKTGALVLPLKGHGGSVLSASFNPDGSRIVTACDDQSVRLWDAKSGNLLAAFRGVDKIAEPGEMCAAAFSPDGKQILSYSCTDGGFRLWEAKSGGAQLLQRPIGAGIKSVAPSFSPDGKQIVIGEAGANRLLVGDTATGVCTWFQGGAVGPVAVSFSTDGKRIVTTNGEKTATVREVKTGQESFTLKGHAGDVTSAAFSPDGKRIATGSSDKTVRLWEARAGTLLFTLQAPDVVRFVSWSPDGTRIVIGCQDKTARIWDGSPE